MRPLEEVIRSHLSSFFFPSGWFPHPLHESPTLLALVGKCCPFTEDTYSHTPNSHIIRLLSITYDSRTSRPIHYVQYALHRHHRSRPRHVLVSCSFCSSPVLLLCSPSNGLRSCACNSASYSRCHEAPTSTSWGEIVSDLSLDMPNLTL